jgi:hypothetical protein
LAKDMGAEEGNVQIIKDLLKADLYRHLFSL